MALNSKDKSFCSCFNMKNTLRIKVWMLEKNKMWTLYFGGS